jgi:hypothetical protein
MRLSESFISSFSDFPLQHGFLRKDNRTVPLEETILVITKDGPAILNDEVVAIWSVESITVNLNKQSILRLFDQPNFIQGSGLVAKRHALQWNHTVQSLLPVDPRCAGNIPSLFEFVEVLLGVGR